MMRFHRPPERSGLFPATAFGMPSMAAAMAVVMASTGPLPVLAAGRTLTTAYPASAGQAATATFGPSSAAPASLLANQDDSKDKKKKKNQQQNPHSGSGSQTRDQHSGHGEQKQQLNKKQRERIYEKGYEEGKDKGLDRGYKKGNEAGYQEGYQKGKDKGINKGYEKGYDKGWGEGKDKGINKGYDKGYDKGWYDRKARDKDRWKDWDSNRWRDYNRRNRDIWTKRVVVNNNYGGYPGWARNPGWYNSRPWGGNWYGGWSSPPWGWWAGQSLVWGVTALTTAAIINNSINRAITQRQTAIVVPNTNWQLYYGTVQPVQSNGVTFAVNNGYGTFQMEADCQQGLLNGDVPSTPAEAQLINAACQVTYGRGV